MLRSPLQELFKQYGKWLEMDAAIKHCTAGICIWKWGNQQ